MLPCSVGFYWVSSTKLLSLKELVVLVLFFFSVLFGFVKNINSALLSHQWRWICPGASGCQMLAVDWRKESRVFTEANITCRWRPAWGALTTLHWAPIWNEFGFSCLLQVTEPLACQFRGMWLEILISPMASICTAELWYNCFSFQWILCERNVLLCLTCLV